MKKDTSPSIPLLVADMLNAGVEPGRCVIAVKPERSVLYFAYTGSSDRTLAKSAIAAYLSATYGATEITLRQSQYAKSRFKYLAEFETPVAIDPSQYTVQKVDLSTF